MKVLLILWQLPQQLVGLVVILFYRAKFCSRLNHARIYRVRKFKGMSLGSFIFVREVEDNLIKHEYGHTRQSMILGPFYLLVIGLPSIIHAIICSSAKSYYNFYTERWANSLGGLNRK